MTMITIIKIIAKTAIMTGIIIPNGAWDFYYEIGLLELEFETHEEFWSMYPLWQLLQFELLVQVKQTEGQGLQRTRLL